MAKFQWENAILTIFMAVSRLNYKMAKLFGENTRTISLRDMEQEMILLAKNTWGNGFRG
jgi:hypothetical protein